MTLRLWEGPSEINGEPIMLAAGALKGSLNRKTNHMVQTQTTPLADKPSETVKSGADVAVCGSCAFRPSEPRCPKCDQPLLNGEKNCTACGAERVTCYVRAFQAPNAMHKAALRRPIDLEGGLARLRKIGRPIRLGEYGNPSAMPLWLVEALVQTTGKWTGYEHQWSSSEAEFERCRPYLRYAMASANNLAQAERAWAEGFRTYRTLAPGEGPVDGHEIMCPHYTHGVRCETCLLCDGTRPGDRRKSICGPQLRKGRRHDH